MNMNKKEIEKSTNQALDKIDVSELIKLTYEKLITPAANSGLKSVEFHPFHIGIKSLTEANAYIRALERDGFFVFDDSLGQAFSGGGFNESKIKIEWDFK